MAGEEVSEAFVDFSGPMGDPVEGTAEAVISVVVSVKSGRVRGPGSVLRRPW
jgi:hypothetical protein